MSGARRYAGRYSATCGVLKFVDYQRREHNRKRIPGRRILGNLGGYLIIKTCNENSYFFSTGLVECSNLDSDGVLFNQTRSRSPSWLHHDLVFPIQQGRVHSASR